MLLRLWTVCLEHFKFMTALDCDTWRIVIYRITGIIRERKCSRIGNFFLIHEKTFANGDNPYSFLVQLPISPLATPIFPTKVATVEALQSNMRQCSSYSWHTHLQLLNRVILPKHSNTAVEYSPRTYDCSLKTLNLICAGTLTEVRQASVQSLHYV